MFLTGRWISRPEDIYFLSLGILFFTDSVVPNISATGFPQKQMKVVRRHMMLWSACVLWSNNCTQTNVSVALLNAAYKRLWLPRNSQQSYGALKRSQVFALSVSALKTATINLRVHRVTDNLSVGTVTTDYRRNRPTGLTASHVAYTPLDLLPDVRAVHLVHWAEVKGTVA